MRPPLRRSLGQGLALAVLGAGLAGTPLLVGSAAAAPGDGPDARPDAASPSSQAQREARDLLERMRGTAQGSVRVSTERATGLASMVRAGTDGDLLPGTPAASPSAAVAKAGDYLADYAGAFGAAGDELVRTDVTTDRLGTVVTYAQEHEGIPVFGALVRAHLDTDGDLTSVNGQAVPVEGLSTETRLTAEEAAARAVELVRSDPPEAHSTDGTEAEPEAPEGLRAAETVLNVYREGLVKGEAGATDLVYVTEVTNAADVRDMVFFSATTGKLVNRYSMVHDALERRLYESSPDTEPVWEEGDSLDGLNADQRSIVEASGESYWFFANAFGRDSYDGAGAAMETVNNDPRISCPNANWNGVTTNYCNGVTSDDVVAHEWGHAYTEYTHGLIYQWQPGALNEAYSDIWGETVDLINNRQDEGEKNGPRADGLCSTSSPSVPQLSITAPAAIAKDCATGGASFGQQVTAEGISGQVVAPTDAIDTGGTATDGCSAYEQDVTDRIVLVDRGLCPFTQKAAVATEAGAAALVIGNNDDAPISMSGDEPDYVTTVSVGLTDRQTMRSAISRGDTVEVTIKDAAGARSDSDRWLVGEQSTAFGGAIRDMWSPTCYGDPGKVSDVEYKCSTDDAGGVHSNSGVPNHGYALLVDGGTSNGVTVEGIGMDKAAAIYFRAMDAYQTPSSKFPDHVDALEASCADLTGKRIYELSVATDDRRALGEEGKVTAADCAQIAPMAEATEMREEPVQCDFQPLLGKDAPALCGAGSTTDEVFSEDFESGLGDWTLDGENVYGGPERDWVADTSAPQGANGVAAYGAAGDLGQCDGTTNDFSSVNTMTSPAFTLGEAGDVAPRMSFRHFVATELGFDGGNVQVAVNGGDFAPVPAEAFVYNEPSVIATADEGNTNPLAGQPGFTGTDGGEVTGSWGTSVVDLAAAGIAAGDEVQLRFAIGRDGCGGVDGWYVDDVTVALCEVGAAVTATATPQSVQFGEGAQVDVSVEGNAGAPTGQVSLVDGDRTLGTEPVAEDGTASFALPKRLAVGTYDLDVVYSGDEAYDEATGTVTLTVTKADTATTVTPPATTPATRRLAMSVDVTSEFLAPSGRVTLRWNGTKVGQGFVRNGEATVRLDRRLPVGRQEIVAAYAGNDGFRFSRGTTTVRVTR
ncbi:hypothetical protein GCM10009737_31960 [Nocardioides lentus]|uniref:Zn-dependent metalloprotease n=1 Tax=Nocardioides lentus TaxID=338077 RepID=A0ABP5B0B0_9ACTN